LSEQDKPFWLRPPYLILFDLLRLHRIKPWDVNITNILNAFLAAMKERGHIDFSVSGTALLSAAIIHRMKSELVLKMEDPPKPPIQRPQEDIPPPLPLPLRFEYTATSLTEILSAIEEVLKSEMSLLSRETSNLRPTPVVEALDDFIANIQEHLESLYHRLIHEYGRGSEISFRVLTLGVSIQEIVRTFLLILFLASKGRVRLSQDLEFGDIKIAVAESREGAGAVQHSYECQG
jgi:segregation and condensation protein A